ncbi:MAG: hypothetical protein ACYDGR_16880, partial [Candidatus Dormibacteria bacterium]
MTTTAEVENATLAELGQTHIDDVLELLDHGQDRLPTYRELYLRWERQQWLTQDLDFTQDRLDHLRLQREQTPEQAAQTASTNASFWIGEHQVTV